MMLSRISICTMITKKGSKQSGRIFTVLLEAIDHSDASIQLSAVESLIFYLEKIMVDGSNDFRKIRESISRLFCQPEII